MEIITQSAQATQKLGEKIASDLIKNDGFKRKSAIILALYGELGSGKTTFVRGFARGLGLPHRILSPTFIVVREYPLNTKNFRRFYHLDLYRMEKAADLETLGISEIFQNPAHLVVVEWAERLGKLLPEDRIDTKFKPLTDDERLITIVK